MNRSNDNQKQPVDELQRTVAQLALRMNQLFRMLEGKELYEVDPDDAASGRLVRFSFQNGITRSDYKPLALRWR